MQNPREVNCGNILQEYKDKMSKLTRKEILTRDRRTAVTRSLRLVTDKIDAAPVAIRAMLKVLLIQHGYGDFAEACAALADEMRPGEVKTCLEGLRAALVNHSVSLADHQEAARASVLAAGS